METLNRSDRSDMFQDRELMEAVLQKTDDPGRLNDSGGSRLSSLFIPQQSLRSTGNLSRPPSIVSNSKRSVAFSQEKISDVSDPLVEKEDSLRLEYLKINIIGLVMLSVCSLILALVSLQLTLYLGPKETTPASSVVDNNQTFMTLVEVATALSTFVVTLDITCLLVCSMQCLVVIKLLSVDQGEDRALKFLVDCSSSRFIAVTGFYVSVPVFPVALILYVVSTFTSAAAITASVVLAAGTLFCILSAIQNLYHWRVERSRGMSGLPVFDHSSPIPGDRKFGLARELSTLV